MLICSEKKKRRSHRDGERMYVNVFPYSENKDGSFSPMCTQLWAAKTKMLISLALT